MNGEIQSRPQALFVSRVESKCRMPVAVNVMEGILDTGFSEVAIEGITDRYSLVNIDCLGHQPYLWHHALINLLPTTRTGIYIMFVLAFSLDIFKN